jgi:hypothetical protein
MRRILFGLLVVSSFAVEARALSVSEYLDSEENFKIGYIFAMMEALTLFSDSLGDDQHSLKLMKCFLENKINSKEAKRIVGRHILRTPDASTTPMALVVLNSFNETCKAYLN